MISRAQMSKEIMQSPAQKRKVKKVMSEYKSGDLKSGSGKKVTNRDQAVAIAMSEANAIEKKFAGGIVGRGDGRAVRGLTRGMIR